LKIQIDVIRKRTTPWYIIIKMSILENKERILKSSWEKWQLTYVRITWDLSAQALKVRKASSNTIQALRESTWQPRILYPTKLSLSLDGEIRLFQDKNNLEQFNVHQSCIMKDTQRNDSHGREQETITDKRRG
jgi:hypothetical protein